MITIFKKFATVASFSATILIGLSSCNKEFNDVAPVPTASLFDRSTTIDSIVKTNPNFSVLRVAVARAGFNALLADSNAQFTFFAPDNAALAAIGVNATTVMGAGVATLQGLLAYHVVPTQRFTFANITSTPPNIQLPTQIQLAPGISTLIRMSVFLSRRGTNAWANNVPISTADIAASNGIIHILTARPLNPVATTIRDAYVNDLNLTMLRAAITRADSGLAASNPGRLDSIANNPFANLTLLAPSNAAFGNLFYPLLYPSIYAQTAAAVAMANPLFTAAQVMAAATPIAVTNTNAASTNPLIFSNPALFGTLTAQTVRGIIAYHIFTSRYYGVNTQTAVSSLTAGGAALPPVGIDFNGGAVRFLGAGNGAGNFSNVTTADDHRLNGVMHIIDRVLRPQ